MQQHEWNVRKQNKMKTQYVEWKKYFTQKMHIMWCHLHEVLKQPKLPYGKNKKSGETDLEKHEGTSWSDWNFYILK